MAPASPTLKVSPASFSRLFRHHTRWRPWQPSHAPRPRETTAGRRYGSRDGSSASSGGRTYCRRRKSDAPKSAKLRRASVRLNVRFPGWITVSGSTPPSGKSARGGGSPYRRRRGCPFRPPGRHHEDHPGSATPGRPGPCRVRLAGHQLSRKARVRGTHLRGRPGGLIPARFHARSARAPETKMVAANRPVNTCGSR